MNLAAIHDCPEFRPAIFRRNENTPRIVRAPGHREQPDRSIVNAKINPS